MIRMTISRFVLLVTLLLGVAFAETRKPNVVFFLVDDLGWSDVGCFGSSFYDTPNVDRLAEEGVRFTSGYAACHVCSPTRASILTGKYPATLNLTDWLDGRSNRPYQVFCRILTRPWLSTPMRSLWRKS